MQLTEDLQILDSKDSYRLLSDEQRSHLEYCAHKLQRKHRLLAVVMKRQANIQYLHRVHLGDFYWLNCVLISKQTLRNLVRQESYKQRAVSFFYLGFSLARLLNLPNGTTFINSVCQLFEEWEYYFSGSAVQSVKYVLSRNSTSNYPQTLNINNRSSLQLLTTNEPINTSKSFRPPSLSRFNNTIVYEVLQCPHLSQSLDYLQVLLSLCEVLTQLYSKLSHPDSYTNKSLYDAIVKLDLRIKHHFINLVSKELTELSFRIMRRDLLDVRGSRSTINNNNESVNTNSTVTYFTNPAFNLDTIDKSDNY